MVFDIDPSEIENENPFRFAELMNKCLEVEADQIGVPLNDLQTTLKITEPDGGVDARIKNAPSGSSWLPTGQSVWQYKSGGIRPQEIEDEFDKAGVQGAVKSGGTWCIALGRDYGHTARTSRENAVASCFAKLQAPPTYRLLTASDIARWASRHLALLLWFRRPMGDIMTFERWSLLGLHQTPYHRTDTRNGIIADIQAWAGERAAPVHRRIEGPAGVGKTRLALEALRPQLFADLTYYVPSPEQVPVGLFAWIEAHKSVTLIFAVDECDREWALSLASQAERCDGRLRLLTIHQGPARIHEPGQRQGVYVLEPLSHDEMESLLAEVVPGLHPEGRRWVARSTGGYVSLARALAEEIQEHPELAAANELARQPRVEDILNRLLPDEDHQNAMKVVALLTKVGWDGDLAAEGQATANFIGIPWPRAQDIINEECRRGLVQRQGRYRYVTPHLLAVWLASEVWEARGSDMLELLKALPSLASQLALLYRLADFGDDSRAMGISRALLENRAIFPDLSSIDESTHAQMLEMLTFADPGAGLRALERILGSQSVDELRSFKGGRQDVVWTLEKLAWHSDSFPRAARLLLALAEAENDSVANNATGIWCQLFQTSLGGTTVPALDRHKIIGEALGASSVERRLLGVQAIRSALSLYETRGSEGEYQRGRVIPPEWHPRTKDEVRETRSSALHLLDTPLNDTEIVVRRQATDVLLQSARGLVATGLADEVLPRLKSLRMESYQERREVRGTVQDTLKYEGSRLSQDRRTRFEALLRELEGESYTDRLRRWVGKWTTADWLRADDEDPERPHREIAKLAVEGFESPSVLREELDWLASAEAQNVWAFGYTLGQQDAEHDWLAHLVEYARHGSGLVLLAGYLRGRGDCGESPWREDLLDEWAEQEPGLAQAVYEATWRGEPSDRGADRLTRLVHLGRIEPMQLGILAWGQWMLPLSAGSALRAIEALAMDPSDHATEQALGMLRRRVDHFPQEKPGLSEVAWQLLSRPQALASGRDLVAYHWSEVAGIYLNDDPVRLTELIVSAICEHGAIYLQRDRRLNALTAATRAAPNEVWDLVAHVILSGAPGAFQLEMTLRGWYAGFLDTNILLEWATDNLPKGPGLLAALAPVGDGQLGELGRSLLVRFGEDEAVQSLLARNFLTGSFSGPTSAWLQSKLVQAETWAQDEDVHVRRWASELAAYLRKDIEQERLREDELGL